MRGICHVWESWKVHTGFWWGKLQVRDHLEDITMYRGIILKWTLKKSGGRAWTGLIWLGIKTCSELS
jgi:hypothetical protein